MASYRPIPKGRDPRDRRSEKHPTRDWQQPPCCNQRTSNGTRSLLGSTALDPPRCSPELVVAQVDLANSIWREQLPRNRNTATALRPVPRDPARRSSAEAAVAVVDEDTAMFLHDSRLTDRWEASPDPQVGSHSDQPHSTDVRGHSSVECHPAESYARARLVILA
jgi:hypothetical protein